MAAKVEWDDRSIPGDEVLYRRVPVKPTFVGVDLISGEPYLQRAAFQWDEDGISVYRRALLVALRLTPVSVLRNGNQDAYFFEVAAARACGAGVRDSPDDDDPLVGRAHALIQCEADKPSKSRRREIQNALAAAARPYAEG